MIYHVLPGDATAEDFKRTGIEGEMIVCRECLAVGPADAETLFEFWEQRAHFILAEYGGDEIVYHETVADELAKLLDVEADDEVNLWFEYELFCSANMWFCLSLLEGTGAKVFRVEPYVRSIDDRWKGFGHLTPEELGACFAERTRFSAADIKLGSDLWNAFRYRKNSTLLRLGETVSPCFPHLQEVAEAGVEVEVAPKAIVREIVEAGKTDITEVFPEFVQRAGVYGFGDSQVQRLLDQIVD